ncbi:type II toxin-antitoxin system RelB/DinJ family antitoxin [bacterium]|nr:type II toxin-antitoxin system RelB/DinJ family antitoxin [bacterium]
MIANLRIEKDLKEQASDLAKQMGVSLSTIMTLLLQKFVKEKRIEV